MRKTAILMLVMGLTLLASCKDDGGGGTRAGAGATAGAKGSAGADTAESVSKEIVANMKEMGVILNSITDEASAKAAVPRIDAVRAKMRAAGQRAKTVPKIDAETEKRIADMNQQAMAEAMQSIGEAQQRLSTQPELLAIIEPAMRNMEDDL